jgi:hypothetical protein
MVLWKEAECGGVNKMKNGNSARHKLHKDNKDVIQCHNKVIKGARQKNNNINAAPRRAIVYTRLW